MKVWGSFEVVKKFEIRSYSPEYRQGTLDAIRNGFFTREIFCEAAQIAGNKAAEDDLLGLVDDCLSKSKVSFVAIDVESKKVIGAAINLVQVKPSPNVPSYFENFRDNNCKTENAKALIDFMIEADSRVNIFEKYGVDALFELMFVTILPEYNNHGIGMRLGMHCYELACLLKNGINREQYLEPGVPAPKVITTIATMPTTQKFCKGGDLLVHETMSDFSPKMKKFVDNLEDPSVVYEVFAQKL